MRLQDGRVVRRHGHLSRVASAARANGFAWDDGRVHGGARRGGRHEAGRAVARQAAAGRQRRADGRVHGVSAGERAALEDGVRRRSGGRRPIRSCASRRRGGRSTTPRARARPGLDDVVLWTRGGEVTESTIANVVVELDGALYTPPSTRPLLRGRVSRRAAAGGAHRGARDPQGRGRIGAARVARQQPARVDRGRMDVRVRRGLISWRDADPGGPSNRH